MPDFVAGALRDEARTLDGAEAFSPRNVLAYDESGARVLEGMRITPGLPGFLGVVPVLGRGFTPADAEAGAPAVVILGYEAWQRDYGGARDVVGRTLTLDEVPHVVVGVLPAVSKAFLLRDDARRVVSAVARSAQCVADGIPTDRGARPIAAGSLCTKP